MRSVIDLGPPPPCPQPFNLADYVLAAGAETPDKIALAVLGVARAERWSFGRLRAAVQGCAAGLWQAGLHPGDRVLLRLGNSVEFPIAYLGAIWAGLIPVPTSDQLTAPEVEKICVDLQPAAILQDPSLATGPAPQTIPVAQMRSWYSLPGEDAIQGDPNRPAYIVFTSGTSGQTRGVVHAHRAIWARRMMWQGWYDLRADDRVLHAGAMNWTYTLGTGLLDPWSIGATALVPAAGTDPAALPLLLKRHQASLFATSPGVFRRLLRTPEQLTLPHLRHALSAGEKLPETLRDGWRAATGTAIYEAFGMSECSTFLSAAPGNPAAAGCVGTAQPGRHIALLDDDQPVPLGTPGRIAISTSDPGLMLGYLNEPPVEGPWFVTADQAVQREDGQIEYHGRCDDILTTGGHRISPLEVEAALAAHPAIDEAAVTDVAVGPETRVLAAFYTGDAPLQDRELEDFASNRLARYKQLRVFVHVDSLPRNANGKLLRRALRDSYEAQHGQT